MFAAKFASQHGLNVKVAHVQKHRALGDTTKENERNRNEALFCSACGPTCQGQASRRVPNCARSANSPVAAGEKHERVDIDISYHAHLAATPENHGVAKPVTVCSTLLNKHIPGWRRSACSYVVWELTSYCRTTSPRTEITPEFARTLAVLAREGEAGKQIKDRFDQQR